jgi:NADH:ubiquinone oxidoreductase subunit 6 (subunit J)
MITTLFWIILSILCLNAIFLFTTKNALYALYNFISFIVLMSSYLLIHQLEFIAISIVIIYIGVIAVLFLFLIFMFEEKIEVIKLEKINSFSTSLIKILNILILCKFFIIFIEFNIIYYLQQLSNYFSLTLSHPLFKDMNFSLTLIDIYTIGFDLYYVNIWYLYLAAIIILITIISCITILKYLYKNK